MRLDFHSWHSALPIPHVDDLAQKHKKSKKRLISKESRIDQNGEGEESRIWTSMAAQHPFGTEGHPDKTPQKPARGDPFPYSPGAKGYQESHHPTQDYGVASEIANRGPTLVHDIQRPAPRG
jgi:hypothetical protein